jgi:hypothetical protein
MDDVASARAWLAEAVNLANYEPQEYKKLAILFLRILVRARDLARAQELYEQLRGDPRRPFEDPEFATDFVDNFMGLAAAISRADLVQEWFDRFSTFGIRPNYVHWSKLLSSKMYASDWEGIDRVWREGNASYDKSRFISRKDHFHYARFVQTFLDAHVSAGSGYAVVQQFTNWALKEKDLRLTPSFFASLMRAAAIEGRVETVEKLIETMEGGWLTTDQAEEALPARDDHYTELANAYLQRELIEHTTRAALPSADGVRLSLYELPLESVNRIHYQISLLVDRMKAEAVPVPLKVNLILIQALSANLATTPKALDLCRSLIRTIPRSGQPWTEESRWAIKRFVREPDPVERIFASFLAAGAKMIRTGQSKTEPIADAFKELVGAKPEAVGIPVIEMALRAMLTRTPEGSLDESGVWEVWQMAMEVAESKIKASIISPTSSSTPSKSRSNNAETSTSLVPSSSNVPHVSPHHASLLSHAITQLMTTLVEVDSANNRYDRSTTDRVLVEWDRLHSLGFGFTPANWNSLALLFLQVGQVEDAFEIVEHVMLWQFAKLEQALVAEKGIGLDGEKAEARMIDAAKQGLKETQGSDVSPSVKERWRGWAGNSYAMVARISPKRQVAEPAISRNKPVLDDSASDSTPDASTPDSTPPLDPSSFNLVRSNYPAPRQREIINSWLPNHALSRSFVSSIRNTTPENQLVLLERYPQTMAYLDSVHDLLIDARGRHRRWP